MRLRSTFDDLVAVILAWDTACGDKCGTCTGDTTNDGLVNVDDLVAVILGWSGNCSGVGGSSGGGGGDDDD